MNILIIGKDGQVGRELQKAFVSGADINVASIGREECDLLDLKNLQLVIDQFKPGIIVNAAAYTKVDDAEMNENEAFAINAKVPELLAEWSKLNKSLIFHYSTDYVFDGSKSSSYSESDIPNPINIYGKSKLAGEAVLLEDDVSSIVLRTSWVYGKSGCNFIKTILNLARHKTNINVVNDQSGTPTSAELIAKSTATILSSYLKSKDVTSYGLYHLASRGATNWYEYARYVVQQASQYGEKLTLTEDNINPISSSEYKQIANRPKNSRLDVSEIERTFGIRMPEWEGEVSMCIKWIIANEKS